MLNELLVERPNYFQALCERIKIYLEQEQFDLANIDIEKALELKPNNPLGFKLKGDLKLLQGAKRNASFYYKLAKDRFYIGVYRQDTSFLNKLKIACP